MGLLGRLEVALEVVSNGALLNTAELQRRLSPKGVNGKVARVLAQTAIESVAWNLRGNVVGLGIGHKVLNDFETGLCLKVYVRKKKSKRGLRAQEVVPSTLALGRIGEVPVDVEAIGELQLEALQDRCRPAMGGYSIGHYRGETGTLACLVRKRSAVGGLYLLSNSHILANAGDCNVGDHVLQPGRSDHGRQGQDTIAYLAEWVDYDFSGLYVNRVDAAIAGPIAHDQCRAEIAVIDKPPNGVRPSVDNMMSVHKVGRTTGQTSAIVLDSRFRAQFEFHGKMAGFLDLALCTRYTEHGDSGSLVMDDHHNAVGLHMAGSPSYSVFCPIQPVLDALSVDLVTQNL